METSKMQQSSNTVIAVTAVAILLAFYSLRTTTVTEIHVDETPVSLCQVHVQYDGSNTLDDRPVLSLLAILKKHDFQISQPVWGPSEALLYFCEHRLKTGLKQAVIDKELNKVIKDNGITSKRLAWSCA